MSLTSFEVSKYLSCLQPAESQSTLVTPMRVCFAPKRLIDIECCLICRWIWLSLAMSMVKPPSAGTMVSTVPTCYASVVMFLVKSQSGCNDDGVVPLVRERLFVVQTMVTPCSHFFLWWSTWNADMEEFSQALHLLLQLVKLSLGSGHPIRVVVVILPPPSWPHVAIGKCFISELTNTSGSWWCVIFCVLVSRSADSRDSFSIAKLCTMFASGGECRQARSRQHMSLKLGEVLRHG